jgi:hypothetical protein
VPFAFEHPYDVADHYFSGQQKLIVSQPGGGQPRLIVPGQHLTLLTSNGTGSTPAQQNSSMLEPKKDGMGFFTGAATFIPFRRFEIYKVEIHHSFMIGFIFQ